LNYRLKKYYPEPHRGRRRFDYLAENEIDGQREKIFELSFNFDRLFSRGAAPAGKHRRSDRAAASWSFDALIDCATNDCGSSYEFNCWKSYLTTYYKLTTNLKFRLNIEITKEQVVNLSKPQQF